MVTVVDLQTVCDYADQVNVYNDGKICVYNSDDVAFGKITDGWKTLTQGAHEMPAFGVSLNRETEKAIKSGLWAEFVFNQEYEHNGMPFEKLLINVGKQLCGFNIIRYSSEYGYDGRCFYIDLVGKNMDNFYDLLLNL